MTKIQKTKRSPSPPFAKGGQGYLVFGASGTRYECVEFICNLVIVISNLFEICNLEIGI